MTVTIYFNIMDFISLQNVSVTQKNSFLVLAPALVDHILSHGAGSGAHASSCTQDTVVSSLPCKQSHVLCRASFWLVSS